MTFKDEVYAICKKVASEFDGWEFASGNFKNKSLKHTDLYVLPGFGFKQGSTPLSPATSVVNKKCLNLCKNIIGYELSASIINFQNIYKDLQYMPYEMRRWCWIDQDKALRLKLAPTTKEIEDATLDITEAKPVLLAMMKDGISTIERCYDLSAEENLLRNLPPKYELSHGTDTRMEMQNGVMICIARILIGDFDFVEHYRSDDYKAVFPKRIAELDKLVAALPDLKRRYAETGGVL